jgi:endoglucanase
MRNFFLFLLLVICTQTTLSQQKSQIFIRMNQGGFTPADIKSAVLFSKKNFPENKFFILNSSGKIVFSGLLKNSSKMFEGFPFSRIADFSAFREEGKYKLRVKGAADFYFTINSRAYNAVRDSLMLFFAAQRCGPTDPSFHEPCHLSDATSLPGFNLHESADVTGGWHDAGDYIKFLSTTAYTTYMLIFSYEYDPVKFGFDNNENSVPDILEEAKIGLDWMLRCRLRDDLLITQVQDLRDHQVGWRMPESDSLRFDRPGYSGIGKNIIGIYSAALSIASRVWADKFLDYDFAEECLYTAESVYSVYSEVPDLDKINSGVYQDNSFEGKLALGAAELYLSTSEEYYLEDAKKYSLLAGSDFWWSWGDINALAHFRLAKLGEKNSVFILNNLVSFKAKMDSSLFSEAVDYTWGTTNTMLGVSLQAILYKNLSGDTRFDSLAAFQRDYILGRNPWGLSFISGVGNLFPVHLHSQVAFFTRGYIPGAMTAGPAPSELLKNYEIKRSSRKYDLFNSGRGRYFDDHSDYITNEPTITGNATALFVFGYYASTAM